MNEKHFSSRRTKTISLNATEMSGLVLLTFRVLSVDSLTVRNIDSQNPGDDANLVLHCNPLVCQQELLENISILKLSPSYKAYIVDCLFPAILLFL